MQMNTRQMIEILKANPECNMVATVGSVLQINCLNATIKYIEDCGVVLNGFIVRWDSLGIGKKEYESNFFQKGQFRYIDGCESFVYTNKQERLEVFSQARKRKKREEFFLIAPDILHPLYYSISKAFEKKRIIYVEIDDGLQNYAPLFRRRLLSTLRNERTRGFINIVRMELEQIPKSMSIFILFNMLKRGGNYLDCKILEHIDGRLRQNEKIMGYFYEALSENASEIPYEKISALEGKVLILGDYTEDTDLVSKLIHQLKNKGVTVVYKPHPRECDYNRIERYSCEIFDYRGIALEVILERLRRKPMALVGYLSSTLLYSEALYGIKAFSYGEMRWQKDDWIYKAYIHIHKHTLSSLISFPKTIDEMVNELSMLSSHDTITR